MIKPESLWGLFKSCKDSKWLGDVCRALGRQDVELDYGQEQMVNTIMQDSGWMDERVEAQRERWRDRQRKMRDKRDMSHVTLCHGDKVSSRDVTLHPSIHPSNISPNGENITRVRESDGRPIHVPTDEEARAMAKQVSVPVLYLPKFFEEMKNHGWGYLNRGGLLVMLNRRNFKAVLRSFYDQAQKKAAAAPTGTVLKQEGYDDKLGL